MTISRQAVEEKSTIEVGTTSTDPAVIVHEVTGGDHPAAVAVERSAGGRGVATVVETATLPPPPAPAVMPAPVRSGVGTHPPSLLRELRERLLADGASALSDLELVTLLIGRGGTNRPASAARRLLSSDGLVDLALLDDGRRSRGRRLGVAQAATLAACFELGRRVYGPEHGAPAVSQASDAHAVTRDLELARREYFVALYLDARNRVLVRETVSVGSLNASIVHPREVFRAAIRHTAASVILVHNHPSGNPEPSPDDIALTRRLAEAGRLLGIEVLDHLIIGRGGYVSLKTRGLL